MQTTEYPYFDTKPIGYDKTNGGRIHAVSAWAEEIIAILLSGPEIAIDATKAKWKLNEKVKLDASWRLRGDYSCPSFKLIRSSADSMKLHFGLFINTKAEMVVSGSAWTFVLAPLKADKNPSIDAGAVQRIGERLTEIVTVGIFPEWYPAIVRRGFDDELIKSPNEQANMVAFAVKQDSDAWTTLISNLLKSRVITFPRQESK